MGLYCKRGLNVGGRVEKRKLIVIAQIIGILLALFIVYANLQKMITGFPEHYDANWIKLIVACGLAIFFTISVQRSVK